MSEETGLNSVDSTGRGVTKEEAEQTALAVGKVIVSSIIHSGNLRYVGAAFQTMMKSDQFTAFAEVILREVVAGTETSTKGFQNRHQMSQFLLQMAHSMREEATRIMFAGGQVTLDMAEELDNLVETAGIVHEAGQRIYSLLEQQMKVVGVEAQAIKKRNELMSQVQDAAVANCTDPDCSHNKIN